MKYKKIIDTVTVTVLTIFLLGCYATTHRGPRTLDPGKISGSVSYLQLNEPGYLFDTNTQLIVLDGRIGVIKGIDVGYMRTIDIEESGSDDGIDTHWMDAKFQLINRENQLKKPTLSLGYGFGNVINLDEIYVNTLYLTSGVEWEKISAFYSFRYENISDEIHWIPEWAWKEDFSEIRKAHILGMEYKLNEHIRPVFEMGRIYQDEFDDGLNVLTAGLNFYR